MWVYTFEKYTTKARADTNTKKARQNEQYLLTVAKCGCIHFEKYTTKLRADTKHPKQERTKK